MRLAQKAREADREGRRQRLGAFTVLGPFGIQGHFGLIQMVPVSPNPTK